MEIISTFSALSFGEKRRKISKSGSFVTSDPNHHKVQDADEKKTLVLPSNIPFRVATLLLKLCGPESGFAFSRPETCPVFGCIARPSLTLIEYAKRLDQLMRCTSDVFVVAAILIERLYACSPELFCELSTHRILGTAAVIACKFCEDDPGKNSFYASCLGTNVQDLNQMERHFLQHIQYRAFVTSAQFEKAALRLTTLGARPKYHFSRSKTNNNTTSTNLIVSTSSTTSNNNINPDENTKNASHTPSTTTNSQTQPRQQKRKFKEDN
jgi:hypothetical protein